MRIKIKVTLILFLAILAIGSYFWFTDFQLVKKIVGYNLPKLTALPPDQSLNFLTLPEGLSIHKFAEGLDGPRVIAFDPMGRMFVSETKAGRVVLLEDEDGDGLAEKKTVMLENRKSPHGLAFYTDAKTKKTYLYVAETHQVARFEYDIAKKILVDTLGRNIANLPADGRHFTRTIAFGPNYRKVPILGGGNVDTQTKDKLYISVGSSCDVCVETETWKRAAILESDPDGKYTAEFAGGLRNTVFFTFHPDTKEIWATEMGRDNLGDNLPPDEINIVKVAEEGDKFGARRYGWPFCYGNRVKDTTFKFGKIERTDLPTDCAQTEPATIELPAHSAPLGLAFVTSDKWPKEWRNDLLVAYHGSWNRSEPAGYKIVKLDVDEKGHNFGTVDFISGWLAFDGLSTGSGQAKILGRPVDLKFGPDDALYITDDSAGIVFRVTL